MNGNRKKSTLTEDASVQTPDCLLTGASTADSPDPGNYRSRPQVPAHSDIQSFPNDSRHIEISGLLFLERSLRHRMTTNPRPWMIGRVGAIRGWNESIDCRQEIIIITFSRCSSLERGKLRLKMDFLFSYKEITNIFVNEIILFLVY